MPQDHPNPTIVNSAEAKSVKDVVIRERHFEDGKIVLECTLLKKKGVVDDGCSNAMFANTTINPILDAKSKVVITQIKENTNQAAMHSAPTTQPMMCNPTMNNQCFSQDNHTMCSKDENMQNGQLI